MVMDQSFSELYGSSNGLDLSGDSLLDSVNENNGEAKNSIAPEKAADSSEDFDFSDVVLKYINQMLMEEDMEEKACMFQESAALQAQEQSLYELIGEKYPSIRDDDGSNKPRQATSQSSCSSSSGTTAVESPVSTLRAVPGSYDESESAAQFMRGFEEASKLIPKADSLVVDLDSYKMLSKGMRETRIAEKSPESGRKKNVHRDEVAVEERRSNKQSAVCSSDSTVSPEMFDMVLLNCGKNEGSSLRGVLQSGSRARGKRQSGRRSSLVDLRTLLTLCAQSVAANDRRTAEEYLRQIRSNSSPAGDAMQRLSQCFADGLEARMAGSGTQVYKALIAKPTSAADVLKAYHLFLDACPFKKLSNFFANKTIMKLAEGAERLHIVDFGILYGFPWPCLIQRLSSRTGGPPRLRITGIDFPQPGFRPAERVEETGRRLKAYAETFNVPFKFAAIARKWDTIRLEDLRLEGGEVLVVNCMHRLRNLVDETVVAESPRDAVLRLVREMRPAAFVLGTVNGAYGAPFFLTRFREALFHFSTLFDMLDTNVERDVAERTLIEREIFGREAMNVIACEGAERIERPESYKQWQVRNARAGLRQLPLDRQIFKMAEDRVRSFYHRDFVIDRHGDWLLQGWKGRIVFTLSSWASAP